MDPLKPLLDNSSICVCSVLDSVHCLFSMTSRFAWLLVELVVFYYTLNK